MQSFGASLKLAISTHRLSERGSVYLDFLRGLSAVLVMIGHLRGLFFVPFGEVANPTLVTKALYFLTSLGHEAVVVFFVLSGYFIAGSVMRALADGSWQWRPYMTRRFARLYVVLLPALVIGGLIDLAGIKLFGTSGIYWADPDYRHIVPHAVQDRLNVQTFFANALFLQEIWSPTFGSNGPLWSLSYEFWFYVMFPCAALFFAAGSRVISRLLFGAAFVAICFFVGPMIFAYFFIWLLGAAVVAMPRLKDSFAIRIGALVVIFVVCFALLAARGKMPLSEFSADALLAGVIAALIYVLASWPRTGEAPSAFAIRFSYLSRDVAGFSYTLYLVHLPLLVFLEAAVVWNSGTRWQPDATHAAIASGIALFAIAYAFLISRVTEAHTAKVAAYFLGGKKGKGTKAAS